MFKEALMIVAGTAVTFCNPETLVGIIFTDPNLIEMAIEQIQAYALPEAVKSVAVLQTRLDNAPLEGAKYLEEQI